MPDNFYIGVDNTQRNSLRAVGVFIMPPFIPVVQSWVRARPGELQSFVRVIETRRPTLVATSPLRHDPGGAIAWLETKRIPLVRYPPYVIQHFLQTTRGPQPRIFNRAHALAIRAAYACEAPAALESLWREFYWQRPGFCSCEAVDLEMKKHALIDVGEAPWWGEIPV